MYLPCRGYKDSEDRFLDTLDELKEIVTKYAVDAHIVLVGDLNASLHREQPIARDEKLKSFLEKFQITTIKNYPIDYTYMHGNGKSVIDYILQSDVRIVKSVEVQSECSENTSPHYPVVAKLVQIPERVIKNVSSVVNQSKVNWKKVNKNKYKTLVSNRIRSVDSDQDCDVNSKVEKISDILMQTVTECAPKRRNVKPKNKRLWCPELNNLARKSKIAHKQWKNAGKPIDPENSFVISKNACKKQLRKQQRQIAAEQRNSLYKEIMITHTDDKKLFYKLVNRQRNHSQYALSDLIIDDVHVTEVDMIRQGWASYFHRLATPVDDQKFDNTYKSKVELRRLLIQNICEQEGHDFEPISVEQVTKAIQMMKNNKAADMSGLTAEHIKYGGDVLAGCLTSLVNKILRTGKIPEIFKQGVITPVYKKQGKPVNDPNSYRRITITSIVGKLVEKIHLDSVTDLLSTVQNKLQRGFTKDTSPAFGSLLLTEVIAESADIGRPLFTTFIDANKAFDVVWHDSMLVKLYDAGVRGGKWRFLNEWYRGLESFVKWEGKLSEPFKESQGVRQGGIWSPTAYKHFLNPLLNSIAGGRVGLQVGSIFAGLVAVADDLLFLADTEEEMQCQLNVQGSYACEERYTVSETKTKVMCYNLSTREEPHFLLNGKDIETVNSYKHLGITRKSKINDNSELINERIQLARSTVYAMMGAGLHGLNGVNPEVSVTMWKIYIRPRLLYGLESIKLSSTDISRLDKYQRDFLRQIQHLPERVAACSVYIMSGLLPIEAEIHKAQLTLFGNIIRQDCVERDIALRQLAVKDFNSNSWFMSIQKILFQYELPSAHDLLENPPEKIVWKCQLKSHISEYWEKIIVAEARLKSSLRYLNFENYKVGSVHQLWSSAKYNQFSVHKAFTQVKLSLGIYILQSNRARFNQFAVSKLCPLCLCEEESLEHFLLRCGELQVVREPYVHRIRLLLESTMDITARSWSGDDLVRLILDPSVLASWCEMVDDSQILDQMFMVTRSLCYAMHTKRTALLDNLK
ncbi:MAG: reverse transcriptase family protein [Candidatus Thiodiazotropha sp.]